jgi:1-acyl-sn-glycerol-3-phosphate acyltransferase
MSMFESAKVATAVFTRTYRYLRLSRDESRDIEQLKIEWARETLDSVRVSTQVLGSPQESGPLFLVGNHISYLDIPLLMLSSPGVSFLAKAEIQKWPAIGLGAKVMGTTFVRRESKIERASARLQVAQAVRAGAKLALFPSGTTSVDESKPWRVGVFDIAYTQGFKVQPFRIRYSPIEIAAYIGRDFFPTHLYRLAREGGVKATIEYHPPVKVDDPGLCCEKWWNWSREGLIGDFKPAAEGTLAGCEGLVVG